MELRLPAAHGGILLIRSLAVQPLSFFAFFNPLYSKSWSFATARASEFSADFPWSEEDEAIEETKP
jgi:hypothetical protein